MLVRLHALVRLYAPRRLRPLRPRARTDTGAQPLVSTDGKLVLAVNGEIYNHVKLRSTLKQPYKFKTHSDCEVIIPLVRFFFSSVACAC